MAILQGTKVSSAALYAMPGVGDGQSAKAVATSFTTTTAPALNDVIQSGLIQAGSVILDVIVTQSGMGASGAFSVGYGGNAAYYSAAATGVAATVRRMDVANIPLVLTANDTIDVTVTTAGATAVVTFTIIVIFVPLNN